MSTMAIKHEHATANPALTGARPHEVWHSAAKKPPRSVPRSESAPQVQTLLEKLDLSEFWWKFQDEGIVDFAVSQPRLLLSSAFQSPR